MSEGILSRVLNLVRGASEQFLKDLERDNPEVVYQAAIDTHLQRMQQVRSSIGRLAHQKDKQNQEAARLLREAELLSNRAAMQANKDDAEALRLLELRVASLARRDELLGSIRELEGQIEEQQRTLDKLKSELTNLTEERDRILAELAIQSAGQVQNADPLSPLDAADRALQTVRSAIGAKTSPTSSTSKEQTREKAMAELEALKKARAASGSASSATPASPPATRTLDVATPEPATSKATDRDPEDSDAPASPSPVGDSKLTNGVPPPPRRSL